MDIAYDEETIYVTHIQRENLYKNQNKYYGIN